MKKEIFFVIVLCAVAIAEEISNNSDNDNKEVGRRKKFRFPFHHGLGGYGFGLPALAILYWVKVKLIVIAFAVGMAFVWGFKYFWPHKTSCPEVIHEGPIIPYETSFPSWSDHHHHHGYSSSHPDEHSYPGPDPYSAWSSYSEVSPPESVVSATSYPYKRESKGRQIINQNQISDVVFSFLGVGSEACRKRFLCELEFRSKLNPLTDLAFNIFGQRIFSQYIQKPNDEKFAQSFAECGQIYNECEFIEEDIPPETVVEEESESNLSNSSEDTEKTNLENSDNSDTNTPERKRRDFVAESILARPIK